MTGSSRRLATLAAVLSVALASLVGVAPTHAADPEPLRVLIVGDSVAQGSAGDWTWRYRLWQHFQRIGVDVDLVGPRQDLYDVVTGEHGSQAYEDPAFDRDSASRWGWLLTPNHQPDAPDMPVDELVATYHPDVVVEARGINDFVWLSASKEYVLGLVEDEVEEIRGVDPDVDVVFTRLPQTWWDESRNGQISAYNQALGPLVESLDTPESRVVTTDTGTGWVEGIDTWDPAHLSATGEVRMAAAVADSLAEVGVGAPHARPLPAVVDGHWRPAALSVTAGDGEAALSWVRAPGIPEQYVWRRDVTAGEDWVRLQWPLGATSWTAGGLVNGHTYGFRLQALKGAVPAATFSNVVQVRPVPPPPTAAPSVRATPGDHAIRLTWDPVPGATAYDVRWSGGGGSGSRTLSTGILDLTGLQAGAPYELSVTPRNLNPVAGPRTTVRAVPTGPRPAAATGLTARDRGRRTVRLTWAPATDATRYVVVEKRGGSWREVATVTRTGLTLRHVKRGVHQWRVRTWHQSIVGPWSRTVRLRVR